VLPANRHFLLR